jgi:hypothetical protein
MNMPPRDVEAFWRDTGQRGISAAQFFPLPSAAEPDCVARYYRPREGNCFVVRGAPAANPVASPESFWRGHQN